MRPYRHRIAAALLLLWLLMPSSASAQQLDVVLSCPPYDAATGAGNNPANPQDPQTNPMDVSGDKPILCQVLYGNTSGTTLTNVRFTLQSPSVMMPYAPSATLPDGDPMMALLHPSENVTHLSHFAPVFEHQQAGFPAGSWSAATGSYTWNIASIAPGQTGELRVGAYAPALQVGTRYEVTLSVQIGAAQPSITRRAPIEQPASRLNMQPPELRWVVPIGRNNGQLVGRATPLNHYFTGTTHRPQDSDQELIVYLPWINTATGQVQSGDVPFNSANTAHRPLILVDQISAEAILFTYKNYVDVAYYKLSPGTLSAPASGPNTGRVLRYDAATNSLRLRYGRTGSIPPVLFWRLPLNLPLLPASATSLQPRVCHRSYNTALAFPAQPQRCTTPSLPIVTQDNATSNDFDSLINLNNTHNEASPLLPYSRISMAARGGLYSSFGMRNVNIYIQMPGDSQRRTRFISAKMPSADYNLTPAPTPPAAQAIYISTTPSGYGSEADLHLRTMPASSGAQWRRCDNVIAGQPAGLRCTAAHLQAMGVDPNDVTEVRFDLPEQHQTSLFGPPTYLVEAQLDGTARSSIDGSTFSQRDMRNASIGAKFYYEYSTGGTTRTGFTASSAAEVSAGSQLMFYDTGPRGNAYTTEARALWRFHITNRGASPVNGPLVMKLRMPAFGYEIDNTNSFPGQPFRPRLSASVFTAQTGNSTTVTIPQSDYTATWDAAQDELTITMSLASRGGQLSGISEPGYRLLGAPTDLFVELDGFVRIGAPRLLATQLLTLTGDVMLPNGTRASQTINGVAPFMNVTSVAPALAFSGVATPDPAPGYGLITSDYTLTNPAYRADGTRIPNGATGSARSVALFHRVTRDGDFGLTGRSTFEEASSPHALEIWVRTSEPTMGQKADAASLTTGNGWRRCAASAAVCDAPALAALGIAPAQVRWVAFNMGEVLVTDAAPRGTAPLGGVMRQEAPYHAQVVVRDAGSPQDAILRAQGELFSQDTAQTTTGVTELDVVINAACDTRDVSVYPGAPELCDGKDNDCDGDIDEDFADLGTMCEAGLGACRNQGPVICAPDGMSTLCAAVAGQPQGAEICDGMDNDCDDLIDEGFDELQASCQVDGGGGCMVQGAGACAPDGMSVICQPLEPGDMDGDSYLDVCDCAPGDATRYSMTPGEPASCDADGDGACDGALTGVNPTICLVAGDCDDDDAARSPGQAELCDGLDQDCDGMADNGFDQLGQACAAGQGACEASGVYVCGEDGRGVVCDAVAGAPNEERCDGQDNDCDGEVDEDFAQLGQACEVGQGACEASGMYVCGEDGGGAVCDAVAGAPGAEVCDGVDNDCDGEVDEGDAGGTVCTPPSLGASGDGLVSCQAAPGGAAGALWPFALMVAGLARRRRRA